MPNWFIANMVWRIDEIVDPAEQIDWIAREGFDGVGFHAHPGSPPGWAGIDPASCDGPARAALKRRLAAFPLREIHAPFEIDLKPGDPRPALETLWPVLDFAGDVAATVVTVHGTLPPPEDGPAVELWRRGMADLNARADARNVNIGMEILDRFDQLASWALPRVGVTLDVGHMLLARGGESLAAFGSMGNVIRHIGPKLLHLHIHDVTADGDHRELATGRMNFDSIIEALAEIDYSAGMTFEFHPSFVTGEATARSLAFLRARIKALTGTSR